MLIAFLIALVLNVPQAALALPIAFDFSGITPVGTIVGSFNYDTEESPLALNVRGLNGNATYAMTGWNFNVTSSFEGLPSTTFSNSLAGNTLEFCQGNCVFSSGPVTNLIFRNPEHLFLQLTFDPLLDPTPLTTPPSDLSEWGGFNPQTQRSSVYRVDGSVPLVIVQSGALTASPVAVSEPSSLLLLALSFVSLGTWIWKQQGS